MPWYETILLGCAGGMLPDIMGILKARHGKPPAYLKNAFFWISLVVLAAIGGAASYFSEPTKIIEALSFGYSAPTLISRALGTEHPPESLVDIPIEIGAGFAGTSKINIPIPNIFASLQKWWNAN